MVVKASLLKQHKKVNIIIMHNTVKVYMCINVHKLDTGYQDVLSPPHLQTDHVSRPQEFKHIFGEC